MINDNNKNDFIYYRFVFFFFAVVKEELYSILSIKVLLKIFSHTVILWVILYLLIL